MKADEAIARVDTVRRLEALAHHAWQAVAYLVDVRAQLFMVVFEEVDDGA